MLVLAACASPPAPLVAMAPVAPAVRQPEPPPPPPPPPIEEQLAQLKLRLFILVAEERGKLVTDAKPLFLDSGLSAAAQAHSDDMAKKRSFDVMNPDGNIAVNTLLADPKFRGLVGENAAAQYFTPSLGFDPDKMARGFLDIWLASPGHKNNLTDPRFERTGIGVAANGDAVYAAEIFADDLGLKDP
jgi:uncharacterized protein YkwD